MNQIADTTTGTALTLPEPTALKDLFRKPEGIEAILDRIKSDALAQAATLDVSKKKDRAAITSLAFKVAQSKTALDAAGKELNEERRKIIDAVDAQRRTIRDTLDRVRDDIKAPLIKWEADEAARVDAIKARLTAAFGERLVSDHSMDLIKMRADVDAIPLDDIWAEFLSEAEIGKARTLALLDREIAAAIAREEQAAELARLRKEAADRAEADRLAREAEAAAAAERQRVADEAAAMARAAQEAAEAAQRKAEQDAADLRRQLAEAQERAAREAAEAEARAEQARRDEAARIAQEAEAKAQAERAEADRLAQENAAAEQKAEHAARAAQVRERAFDDALADLVNVSGFTADAMGPVLRSIMAGDIRNVVWEVTF